MNAYHLGLIFWGIVGTLMMLAFLNLVELICRAIEAAVLIAAH